MLYDISDFIKNEDHLLSLPATYWYEGIDPKTGQILKLPRTPLVEAIARQLMQQLNPHDQGKMYGVLLVKTASDSLKVLKAFSGFLNRHVEEKGWASSISGRESILLEEKRIVILLDELKAKIKRLQSIKERQELIHLEHQFFLALEQLKDQQKQSKKIRQEKRLYYSETLADLALKKALDQLNNQSYTESKRLKKFKEQWSEKLRPLQDKVLEAEQSIQHIKQRRKALSRQLQTQMFHAYSVTNFGGDSRTLNTFMDSIFLPTGTGECCAPKLLHYAATHQLIPLAMAEFWWGKGNKDKVNGQFYQACEERCQPLMGFLLSGLNTAEQESSQVDWDISLDILWEDQSLIIINKPEGLLSVPGRYFDKQDSVLSRLRHQYKDGQELRAVHRLDEETSGILIIARKGEIQADLSQQFRQRKIHKIYEAILAGNLCLDQGIIKLPLWGNPHQRPYQEVNWEKGKGKPSVTRFKVLKREPNQTRIEFNPLTGRTHQLRVHSADAQGLGIPILGDRLYGSSAYPRLCLHARELSFIHPTTHQKITLQCKTPF